MSQPDNRIVKQILDALSAHCVIEFYVEEGDLSVSILKPEVGQMMRPIGKTSDITDTILSEKLTEIIADFKYCEEAEQAEEAILAETDDSPIVEAELDERDDETTEEAD